MAEVVVGLESVLALQENSNNILQPAGMTIFGRKVPKLIFPSNREHSVGGRSLKSLDTYLYTVGGEHRTLRQFDFDTINVATENFSNLIFQQAFGYIYKGRLQNGQDIAILKRSGSYSDHEYDMNEASALIKLEHKNLVQLLGYCIAGTEVYFLYDFAPYTSLHDLIVDRSRAPLDWDERYKILLDENLVPKLFGFWFSRCSTINEPDGIAVHVIRKTDGGLMAPEYLLDGYLSTKADVYSFGFLIHQMVDWPVELIYGFLEVGGIAWRDRMAGISSNIRGADSSSISRFMHIAVLCMQEDASDRPTMDAVIGMLLNSSSDTLPLPKRSLTSWSVEAVGAVEEFKSELTPR